MKHNSARAVIPWHHRATASLFAGMRKVRCKSVATAIAVTGSCPQSECSSSCAARYPRVFGGYGVLQAIVPMLVFCRTPQSGFPFWGVLLLSFDCIKTNEKRNKK